MTFFPPHCPNEACPAHLRGRPFPWIRRGSYRRRCDGRSVPRFLCRTCRRTFSSQTFRLDYRFRRVTLDFPLFLELASKMTLRQLARVHGCRRETVERRLDRYGEHVRLFHRRTLALARAQGGLPGEAFVLDELETFEHSRLLQPLTVATLVERDSYFVVDFEVGTLPARKPLKPALQARLEELEAKRGVRRSESTKCVESVLKTLDRSLAPGAGVQIVSDKKKSYRGCIRRALKRAVGHLRISSRRKRNRWNPLFPINFTFAMMRDGLSRLVRRSWAVSKKRERLTRHLWVWVGWRNYVRWFTNRTSETRRSSSARELGLARRRTATREFLRWREFPSSWSAAAVAA